LIRNREIGFECAVHQDKKGLSAALAPIKVEILLCLGKKDWNV